MHNDPEGREKQIIAELLGSSAGDLLEVGCGDGRLTRELVNLFGTVIALDPDFSSVKEALADLSGRTRFFVGSGEELPLLDDCADTVIFSLSLHHQDPVKALGEARRVLREGGRILVLEPVEHSLVSMLFALIHDESEEYEKVEETINNSGLAEMRTGSIRSQWVFEDLAEMTSYLFNYYGMEPEPEKEKEMVKLLGNRRKHHPLCVEDITRFWLLCEEPDQDQELD